MDELRAVKRKTKVKHEKLPSLDAESHTISKKDLQELLGLERYEKFEKYLWNENGTVKFVKDELYFFTSDVCLFKHEEQYQKTLERKREATKKKREDNNG